MPTNYTIKPSSSSTRESRARQRTICSLMFEFPNLSLCVGAAWVNRYHPPCVCLSPDCECTHACCTHFCMFSPAGMWFKSRARPRPRLVSYCEKISGSDERRPKSLLMLLPCARQFPEVVWPKLKLEKCIGLAAFAMPRSPVDFSRRPLWWDFAKSATVSLLLSFDWCVCAGWNRVSLYIPTHTALSNCHIWRYVRRMSAFRFGHHVRQPSKFSCNWECSWNLSSWRKLDFLVITDNFHKSSLLKKKLSECQTLFPLIKID